MFDSLEELASKIAATGYFIDPVMTQVVFLAAKLQKPLLLEGRGERQDAARGFGCAGGRDAYRAAAMLPRRY